MDADGDWNITAHTPKGDFEWALSIATTGDGFTGTLDIRESVVTLDQGRIDGNRLTWESTLERPRALTFTGHATVDGDRISGQVNMGIFGTRSFGGTRAAFPAA